jgi:hypothetical protein
MEASHCVRTMWAVSNFPCSYSQITQESGEAASICAQHHVAESGSR